MLLISFITLSLLISLSTAQLLQWTPEDFTSKSKNYAYVFANFLNPSCPYCQALQPDFEAVAAKIHAKYPNVAVVNANCIDNPQFLTQYGITAYPTLKWFDTMNNLATNQGEAYSGSRSQSAMIEFIDRKIADAASARKARSTLEHSSGEVVSLTPETFEKEVIQSNKYAFVEFYAPWCGYCQKVRPIVAALAKAFAGESKVLIADLDASAHVGLGTEYGVRGYPTFKLFIPGLKDPIDYNEGRDLKSFVRFINEHAGTNRNEDATPDLTAGVINSLEADVKKFMEEAEKAATLKKIEKKIENVPDDTKKYYLGIMKKVVSEGVSYVEKELGRLQGLLADGTRLSREKSTLFTVRSNILRIFKKYLGDAGHAEL